MISALVNDSKRLFHTKKHCNEESGYMANVRLVDIIHTIPNVKNIGNPIFKQQRKCDFIKKRQNINMVLKKRIDKYKTVTVIEKIPLEKPVIFIPEKNLIAEHGKSQKSISFNFDIDRVTTKKKKELFNSIGKEPYQVGELKEIAKQLGIKTSQNKPELIASILKAHFGDNVE